MNPPSGGADLALWPGIGTRGTLAEMVDHLLTRGAVVVGDATLSLAGIELVYLRLNLLLSSVETLVEKEEGRRGREEGPEAHTAHRGAAGVRLAASGTKQPGRASNAPARPRHPAATGMAATPEPAPPNAGEAERAEQGLARLALTLVELLRQVVERQALRRVEGGGLNDAEIERMGVALMQLEERMIELCEAFGLTLDDLEIDLGPTGRLTP